ncbi:MAG: hypothetical protein S4CHLAM102_06290 [Chlamydiia bacterium]|nr:hypothetical protein [Chlamydiia bacterium]
MNRFWSVIFCILVGTRLFAQETSRPSFINQSFRELLGEQTECWKNIVEERDWDRLRRLEALYEKNKDAQFTYQGDYRIPKVMHLIWLGPNSFPLVSLENVRSWVANHPDWTLKLWTDRPRYLPGIKAEIKYVSEFSFVWLQEAFDRSTNWGEKSDILRFEVLYREGGVYFDHDANSLRAFDGLHRGYDFYACLESPHDEIEGYVISSGIGIIGSCPFHPVMRGCIDYVLNTWDSITNGFVESDRVPENKMPLYRTYLAMTNSIDKHIDEGEYCNIVFPSSYFYPSRGLDPIYSKHFYGGSWGVHNRKGDSMEAIVLARVHTLSKQNLILLKTQAGVLMALVIAFAFLMWRKWQFGFRILSFFMVVLPAAGWSDLHTKDDFSILMGIAKKPEQYLPLSDDLDNFERFSKAWARKQVEASESIPHEIHFIWVGPREIPEESLENFGRWVKAHPDWDINLWIDREREVDVAGIKLRSVKELGTSGIDSYIQGCENPGEQSHLLRYKILHERGGVYVDHDVVCFQPLDQLIEGIDFFCGLKPLDAIHYESVVEVSNHLIGASKGHTVLKKVMEEIPSSWLMGNYYFAGSDADSAIYRVAYHAQVPFDLVVKRELPLLEERGRIFPASYFYQMGNTAPRYTLNRHAGHWYKRSVGKHEKQIYNRMDGLEKRMNYAIWGTICLGIFAVVAMIALILPMRVGLRRRVC